MKRVEGGCRRDKCEGRKEKGGPLGGGGQEEDEDHSRAVENNTESQNLRNGEMTETTKSTCLLFRGC